MANNITFRFDRRVPGAGLDGLGDLNVVAQDAVGVITGVCQLAAGNWILKKQARPWYVSLVGYGLFAGGAFGLATPLLNLMFKNDSQS